MNIIVCVHQFSAVEIPIRKRVLQERAFKAEVNMV